MNNDTTPVIEAGGSQTEVPPPKKAKWNDSVPMEVDETPSTSQGPNVAKNRELRNRCLGYAVLASRWIVFRYLGESEDDYKDLRKMGAAAGILRSIHNCLRQHEGKVPENGYPKKGIEKEDKVQIGGRTCVFNSIDLAKELISIAKNHFKLDYKISKKSKDSWYGVANPIIAYLSAFNHRLTELRLGTESSIVTKKDGKPVVTNISAYNLSKMHSVLCSGITYSPELRSSILSSVGPMTQFISMMNNGNNDYADKYYRVLAETFKHLKLKAEDWKTINTAGWNDQTRAIARYLANITLMITHRGHERIYWNVAMLQSVFSKEEIKKVCFEKGPANSEIIINCDVFDTFDFSGIGSMAWLKAIENEEFLFPDIGLSNARQAVFHAMFGTCHEDRSILSQITNETNWLSRDEFGDCFRKMGSKKELIPIKPIVMIKGSKMRSALLTNLLPRDAPQLVANPVFSGYTQTGLLDAFVKAMQDDMCTTVGSTRDVAGIKKSLAELQHRILTKVEGLKVGNYGTVQWFMVPGIRSFSKEHIQLLDERIIGRNEFFCKLEESLRTAYEPDHDKARAKQKKRQELLDKE